MSWYEDAIIYEVHVRAFFDSNGDGIGDFAGLTEKLDYIVSLGVDTLWLLPFYPSPLRDDGYDIADYMAINPMYGTMEDFDRFCDAATERGLNIVTELVINHTSDQHEWFQRARQAPKGSPERDWYVWSDDDQKYGYARIIFETFEDSNWAWDDVAQQYYWHRFFHHQPDLNFDNPDVREAVFEICDFWADKGVDGFRLDAITYLYEREGTTCESLPQTHQFLRELRAHLDEHYPDIALLAEANQPPEDTVEYFGDGDECHMCFNFPLMPQLYAALARHEASPIVSMVEHTPKLPSGCRWATFLRNHDELTLEMVAGADHDLLVQTYAADPRARLSQGIRRRLAPLVENDRRRIELLNALLLSMPGTPVIYYGDEIGMGDNLDLPDRHGVRTPMQWTPGHQGGFSSADETYLPVIEHTMYSPDHVNVADQDANPASLLNWMRRAIATRREHRALVHGELTFLPTASPAVLAFERTLAGEDKVTVVVNFAAESRETGVEAGRSLLGADDATSLGPYEFGWFA